MLHPAAARHNTNSEMRVTKQPAGMCGAQMCGTQIFVDFPTTALKIKQFRERILLI